MATTQYKDLLMDVDAMDFIDDNDLQDDQSSNGSYEFEGGESFVRDPNTGGIVMNLTSREELPLLHGEKAKLKFKMGPTSSSNFAFLTEKDKYKLYPVKQPGIDTSEQYTKYVGKLFQIYDNLGEHRVFSIPTIGLVNSGFEKEHCAIVNLAMEAMVSELEFFIEAIKDNEILINRYLELEDSLTILNCLKLIQFTVDSPDKEDLRNSFISELLNWVNRSDGEPNAEYIEQIFSLKSIDDDKKFYENSLFWKLLKQLLLRGLFAQAIGCIERSDIMNYLQKTCEVSSNAMTDLIELIKHYPMDTSQNFKDWKSLVLELSQTFSNSETNVSGELRDYIEDTLLLVSGDQNIITSSAKTWYESFCGLLLYYIPSLELSQEYLQVSLKSQPPDITSTWEQSCVDIINGNVHSILPHLESLDICTAAFTAAIIDAKGLLENYYSDDINISDDNDEEYGDGTIVDITSSKNGMASYMLANFALDLCSSQYKEVWPIAIGLITLIPNINSISKKNAISSILLHYPFKTNDDIEWMFSICAKWKLPEVSRSLYTMLGSLMMTEGKTIEAMMNFSKAGKFELVKEYSWTLFEASVMKGEPLEDEILSVIVKNGDARDINGNDIIIDTEILNNLVTDAMRQSLSPYAVLSKFYDCKRQGNLDVALELLVSLIEFQYIPNYYLVMLISKFLYPIFLLNESQRMSDNIILTVMKVVETKWDSHDSKSQNIYEAVKESEPETLGDVLPDTLEELIKLIRKQLSYKMCQEFM